MAVTSKTDICNLSQDLLSGGTVQDIDNPSSATESLLDRWYDQCRKQVLREHPWNFAAKRLVIAASSTAPAFGYTKAFPLPNDFMRLLTIESDEGLLIRSENYQIESHLGIKSILMSTDAASVRLRYVYDIEDVTKFDAMFISYLALTIALATAYKITESNGNVERIKQLQDQQSKMAKAISGQERPPTRIERSKNRAARMNGSYRNSHRITF
jgi:hypothetical protein